MKRLHSYGVLKKKYNSYTDKAPKGSYFIKYTINKI
ncbi:hypothetical protein SAMN05444408_1216 [Chryseobacterium takakiae]|uniref:Uncharacterized protein n=1 Tax=Chryseobacterium takakiae TaxID=1302685 RepID=A0A1M5BPD9_9FLAO|nr:hypothetical protein SAMN05444408_1216 [Chryseobacterium takakiae]